MRTPYCSTFVWIRQCQNKAPTPTHDARKDVEEAVEPNVSTSCVLQALVKLK